ncbi:MAG: hypothetical protein IJK44_10910 [Bacteroidales bacterium]|nr:hypothetical protein [Bacteroidales bacterium]
MKYRMILAVSLLFSWLFLGAQEYHPREGWPYLLEEFTGGVVTNYGGETSAEGFFNVSVVDGKLHYVSDGTIMVANMNNLQAVRIGESVFINRMGWLKEVVAEELGGFFVLREVSVDMEELAKTDIGFGARSAVASTQKLSGLGVAGGTTVNLALETAIAAAKDGVELPVKEQYVFLIGSREYPADKSTFLSLEGIDKASAKTFLKNEKIRWHKAESLGKVLKYIAENSK